jgi:hypothetical protein
MPTRRFEYAGDVLLAVLLTTLALADDTSVRPSLCVRLTSEGAVAGLPVRELVVALRARIARRQLAVFACAPSHGSTWVMTVDRKPELVSTLVEGNGISLRRDLPLLAELRPYEVAQLVAIGAAEMVRPSVDAVLERLGILGEPDDIDELAADLQAEEPTPPPTTSAWSARALLGASGADREAPVLGVVAMSVLRAFDSFSGGLSLELGTPHRAHRDGAGLMAYEAALALVLEHKWGPLSTGLRVVEQAMHLSIDDSVSTGRRLTLWRTGAGLHAAYSPWQGERWSVGVVAGGTLWLQPRRLLVRGSTAITQPRTEAFIGPQIEVLF